MKKILPSIMLLLSTVVYAGNTSGDLTSLPKIDGVIKDFEWSDAIIFTDFFITVPKSEEKYYDSTIVMVKQTNDAIYFGFKYWPKGKILIQSMTRDRSTENENEFFIFLDLENKNQNGYFFSFNFNGNQRDALVFNTRNQSPEWDWVWESNSKVYKEPSNGKPGYIETEIKIPVDKLQNKNPKQIGFDIQMFSYKEDGGYYWYSIIPNSEPSSLRNTYKMDIKRPFNEKLNLNINATPFAVGNKFNDSSYKAQIGGDVNISFEKHKLKGTYNTDESTLEADPFRFSLYGKPIYLQEKRTFFSKDLDIYRSPINLFYTRSIQNIDYGLNYTYRSDKVKLGAIYVQEENTKKKVLALRPRYNSELFNFGSTFIYTNDAENNIREKVLSLDGKLNLPQRFVFVPQFITNFDGNAYMANLYYEQNGGQGPRGEAGYRRFDENFNAQTLFNDYGSGYDEIWANAGYEFVRNSEYFNLINLNGNFYRARNFVDKYNYQNSGSLNLYYKVNGILSLSHYAEANYPQIKSRSGDIMSFKNFTQEHNARILIGSTTFSLGYYFGKYFDENLKNPYANMEFTLFDRLTMRIAYNYITYGEVKQSIYSAKMDFRILDKLFLRSYFQKDTYNNLALWNTMLQYEFFAGSNFYLVMNLEGEKLQNTRRFAKLGYEFNL